MATNGSIEQDIDAIPTKLLLQLSNTQYACSNLSPPLSSKPGNFVYRGILDRPLLHTDGSLAESIIIKQFTGPAPRILEVLLLRSLETFPTATGITTAVHVVRPPRLYLYDQETNTLLLEDLKDTIGLFPMLITPHVKRLLPSLTAATALGHSLGTWLRSFHTWSSAPEQAGLRAEMWRHSDDEVRKAKFEFTYGAVLEVLGKYPELLEGCKGILGDVLSSVEGEVEMQMGEGGDGFGVVHGDLWGGNILLHTTPSHPNNPNAPSLSIIDWELTQHAHRSCDLGQLLGDLYERSIYRNIDIALSIMNGVIAGYGPVSDEMALRTAIYVGVHLVSWYVRKGARVVEMEEKVVKDGLRVGREFIVRGWVGDLEFLKGSVLGGLFTNIEG